MTIKLKKVSTVSLAITCILCILLSFFNGLYYGSRTLFINFYSGLVFNTFMIFVFLSIKKCQQYGTSYVNVPVVQIKDLRNIKLNKEILPETVEMIIRNAGKNYITYRKYNKNSKTELSIIKFISFFIFIGILIPFIFGMLPLRYPFRSEKIYNLFCNMPISDFIPFFILAISSFANILFCTNSFFRNEEVEFLVIDLNNNCNVIKKNIDKAYSEIINKCIQKEKIIEVGNNSYLITQYTKQNRLYVFFSWFLIFILFSGLIYSIIHSTDDNVILTLFPNMLIMFFSVITYDSYDREYYKHELEVMKFKEKKEEDEYIVLNRRLIFNSMDNKGKYTGVIYINIIEPSDLRLRKIRNYVKYLKKSAFQRISSRKSH